MRAGRMAAVPKASEEGVCKRRDALLLGLQMSGLVGVASVFPAGELRDLMRMYREIFEEDSAVHVGFMVAKECV